MFGEKQGPLIEGVHYMLIWVSLFICFSFNYKFYLLIFLRVLHVIKFGKPKELHWQILLDSRYKLDSFTIYLTIIETVRICLILEFINLHLARKTKLKYIFKKDSRILGLNSDLDLLNEYSSHRNQPKTLYITNHGKQQINKHEISSII